MKLSHWVKESEDPNAGTFSPFIITHLDTKNYVPDYRFAKYNVENPPMSYTEEEYTKYLQSAFLT